jgi:CopG antitoxin of type II toxin-antitoxin system
MSKPTVDLGYPTEPYGRIPAFQNMEEEAEFWDTHDVTDYLGTELQFTEVTVNPELSDRLTIRLDQSDRKELALRAKLKGVGPSTLARIWLKERLRDEADKKAS